MNESADNRTIESSLAAQALARPGAHLPALDGMRGVAILMVMIYHGRIMTPRGVVDDYFLRLTSAGWAGVDMFFVLSGFLITGILFDAKSSGSYFRAFYGRRTVRIFPLYYAYLIVAFFLLPEAFGVDRLVLDHQWYYWLYLSNVLHAVEPDALSFQTAITWSLAVEEQFYLMWPVVVLLCGRRTLIGICAAILPMGVILRYVMLESGVSQGVVYSLTPCRFDTLAVGAAIALLVRAPGGFAPLIRPARIAVVGTSAVLAMMCLRNKGFIFQYGELTQTIGYTAVALLFGGLLILAVTSAEGGIASRFWRSRFLRLLGKYSYAMYLFHVPIQLALSEHIWGREQIATIPGPTGLPGQFVSFALLLLATLAVAALSWHGFEKHFLKLKRHMPYREQPEA